MTNEQILKKAIKKAVKNGWKKYFECGDYMYWHCDTIDKESLLKYCKQIIFSHDFAKAFWGEETAFGGIKKAKGKFVEESILKEYQYHLQQMVLKKEPLKYLEKFL